MIAVTAPLAFLASVIAVRGNRFGLLSRAALALSTVEFVFVLAAVMILFLT